jgi:hypothetical protein
MEKHGMDSVFDVNHPNSTSGEILNLFTHHSLITVEQVIDQVKTLQDKSVAPFYDDYDVDALDESATHLIESINIKPCSQIMPYCDQNMIGPQTLDVNCWRGAV